MGTMIRFNLSVIVLAVLPLCGVVHALGPSYKTDGELVRYPVIVVAQWDRAEVRRHESSEEGGGSRFQAETTLNVLRVIKGRIYPGNQTLLLGWGVAWKEDGTGLATWTSTHLLGDVEDVSKPTIWFLDRKLSWEGGLRKTAWTVIGVSLLLSVLAIFLAILALRERKTKRLLAAIALLVLTSMSGYKATGCIWSPLQLTHYRAIQPLALDEYYAVLDSFRPQSHVQELLKSDNPEVFRRTLHYLCGWIWPWPYTPREYGFLHYETPEERGEVLCGLAETVKNAVEKAPDEVRPLAASVYAELARADSVQYMRSLLADRDPSVRAIAVGILARHKHEASIPQIVKALDGLKDAYLECMIIEMMASWGDDRLVPGLITFLEDGTFSYQYGDELGIPAVKARQGLQRMTGQWFPYGVLASNEAWRQVEAIGEKADRKKMLGRILLGTEFPLKAELVGTARPRAEDSVASGPTTSSLEAVESLDESPTVDGFVATVRVTNNSAEPLSIARYPTSIDLNWPSGTSGASPVRPDDDPAKGPYARLARGEWTEFEVILHSEFLLADPADRELKLMYAADREVSRMPPPTWLGWLPVQFGPLWKEERKLEKAEAR
jgi:hypothetical protein